jgi:transposase InsO family protein
VRYLSLSELSGVVPSTLFGVLFKFGPLGRADGRGSELALDRFRPLDILLIRPDGEIAKPWLRTVIDDYSRAVAGYFLSFQDPSALHTSLALRQAIWRKEAPGRVVCGIPDVLYTDNGSDFTSNHLEQAGADLKIRLVFSILVNLGAVAASSGSSRQ